jgi:trk system potassium uptake protein TrkH
VLVGAFAVIILAGTVALWAPFSHVPGRVGLLDALFTSTSAVCVTGLVVVDTGRDFTPVGQAIILVLIQAGGLGVMTFAVLLLRILGRRLPISSQAAVQDSFFQRDSAAEFGRLFGQILRMTVVIELVGAAVIFSRLAPHRGSGEALGSALFHSVSAFCNAGFSLYRDSLTGFRHDLILMGTVSFLIVLGGAGHIAIQDLWGAGLRRLRRDRTGRISLNTRLVVGTSLLLIAVGAVLLLLTGSGGGMPEALFQSITARTAGFNTVGIGALPAASLLVLSLLMFVGGSPASCAGGIKTTTAAVWLARLVALVRGRTDVTILGRRIPRDLLRRVSRLVGLAVVWNLAGLLLLLTVGRTEKPPTLSEAVFEQVSAFGTVGLSTGLTGELSVAGRLWIVLTMFVGRLGPLTVATWAVRSGRPRIRHAEARVLIG